MSMKIDAIQGLRGIAALMVFFSHAFCMPKSCLTDLIDTPWHIFFDGQIAVMLFFVVSGFFYYKENMKPSVKTYAKGIKNKIFRIFPAYIITMIIGYILCNIQLNYESILFTDWANKFWLNKIDVIELLKQITVVWPHDADLINPPTWYIEMEVRLFLVIPIIIMLCNTKYTNWFIILPLIFLSIYGGESLFFYAACMCGCISKVIYNNLIRINFIYNLIHINTYKYI